MQRRVLYFDITQHDSYFNGFPSIARNSCQKVPEIIVNYPIIIQSFENYLEIKTGT